jgi:hypothetical protein
VCLSTQSRSGLASPAHSPHCHSPEHCLEYVLTGVCPRDRSDNPEVKVAGTKALDMSCFEHGERWTLETLSTQLKLSRICYLSAFTFQSPYTQSRKGLSVALAATNVRNSDTSAEWPQAGARESTVTHQRGTRHCR